MIEPTTAMLLAMQKLHDEGGLPFMSAKLVVVGIVHGVYAARKLPCASFEANFDAAVADALSDIKAARKRMET